MDRKVFLKWIAACRRRMNLAKFLNYLFLALGIGIGGGIFFQVLSLLVPFYYANLGMVICLGFSVATAAVVARLRRHTMEEAALAMDHFGFEERIITAYEHLDEEGSMIALQREDALRRLAAGRDKIRIPVISSRKKPLTVLGMFLLMVGLTLLPSETRELAKELHQVREVVEEKKEEIREVTKELEQFAGEELTAEELAALQEMIESLQASMEEYQQAMSAEELAAASEKLEYKYDDMSRQMSSIAQNLQMSMATAATAQAMQAYAEQLQQMSGQPAATGQLASNPGGQQGQQGQNGGQQGQSGQQGQQGQSGSQQGQGNGQGDGSGNGQGNGQGQGQGDGSGSGSGQSQGNGSGSGRGTGGSDAMHDYVSIPNAIADNESLMGNSVDHDASQYFRAPGGFSWEGTHMSHEAVIGGYEQNAYEGIAAGRYPSGMEDVIKKYFASFN